MKEVLQIAYLRHLQDFYLFESVKDGIIVLILLVILLVSVAGAGASAAFGGYY